MPSSSSAPCTRAVLAVAAVQRDEAAREALALQLGQVALGRDRTHARRRPCDRSAVEHAAARHQRDLALGRRAAHQHRDLAERLRTRSAPSPRPAASGSTLARMRASCQQLAHLRRHVADRAGAHADHDVAVARLLDDRLRHRARCRRRTPGRPCRRRAARAPASGRRRRRSAPRRRRRPRPAAPRRRCPITLTKSSKQSRVRV